MQCVGAARDEFLVEQVTRILHDDLRKSILIQKRQARNRAAAGQETNSSFKMHQLLVQSEKDIELSGRAGWRGIADAEGRLLEIDPAVLELERRAWASAHCPTKLDTRTEDAVRSSLSGTILKAPPIFVGHKSGAESSVAQKLQQWLHSEDGRWWQQSRSALFGSNSKGSEADDGDKV